MNIIPVKQKKYAVVVLSHSSYSDLWSLLDASYSRFFKSDDFEFFIATDFCESNITGRFKPLLYPKDISWGSALKAIVSQLDYERVVFTFDDLILKTHVDVDYLIKYLDGSRAVYNKLICSHVRLYERAFKYLPDFDLSPKDSYRGSLVFACVDKRFMNFLESVAIDGFSPWRYEREINKLLPDTYEPKFKGMRKNIFKFENLVIKGKINPLAYYLLKRKGLEYGNDRQFMSVGNFLNYHVKLPIFTIVKYVLPYGVFAFFRKLKSKLVNSF